MMYYRCFHKRFLVYFISPFQRRFNRETLDEMLEVLLHCHQRYFKTHIYTIQICFKGGILNKYRVSEMILLNLILGDYILKIVYREEEHD